MPKNGRRLFFGSKKLPIVLLRYSQVLNILELRIFSFLEVVVDYFCLQKLIKVKKKTIFTTDDMNKYLGENTLPLVVSSLYLY
jgi:hypothetical protein